MVPVSLAAQPSPPFTCKTIGITSTLKHARELSQHKEKERERKAERQKDRGMERDKENRVGKCKKI